MARAHELGQRGEALAAALMEAGGWTILERNYRVGHKEVDLIARRGATVAFVEVKTRAGPGYGHPLEAVTWAKRKEIEHVARVWIQRHGAPGERYRFDAIAIRWDRGESPRAEHVPDAWRLQR